MNQWIKSLATAMLLLSASTGAWAQDNLYVGVGVGQFTHSAESFGFKDSGSSTGYIIQLGSNTNEYFGVEARLSGTGKANVPGFGASFDTSLASVFLKARAPVADQFHVFGLLGHTSGDSKASGLVTGTAKKGSISYGVGTSMNMDNFSGSLEWVRYWDNVDGGSNIKITIDGISFNLAYTF
ncbi:MAG: hypothetical protein AUJ56_06800 [Zetaproteobacteria bacterium CG1_02_49_23]|nr:MAG: hypothetical protein AUJ56_06800 [Zetaproteobacteria bacterium CG1_02_49_23]